MPSYVEDLLNQKKIAEAIAYVTSDDVSYKELEQLSDEDNDVITFAQLLSIKRPKEAAKKLVTKGSYVISYDRLLLFRELVSGKLFYFVCRKQAQTNAALWALNDTFIGSYVCFYEPSLADEIHGIHVLECTTKPVPIVPTAQYQRIQDIVPALEGSSHIQTFFIQVETVEFKKIVTHRACPSRQCDSCHMPNDPCPAQAGGRSSGTCIYAKVIIPELESANSGQKFISYTSEHLAKLFIHPDSLKLSQINSIRLRQAVARILQSYKNEGIKFFISGWFKRRYLPDGSPSNQVRLHISMLEPRRRLDNVLLYRELQEDAIAPPIAAPAHAIRRFSDFMGGEEELARSPQHEDLAENPQHEDLAENPQHEDLQEGGDEEEFPNVFRPAKRSRRR